MALGRVLEKRDDRAKILQTALSANTYNHKSNTISFLEKLHLLSTYSPSKAITMLVDRLVMNAVPMTMYYPHSGLDDADQFDGHAFEICTAFECEKPHISDIHSLLSTILDAKALCTKNLLAKNDPIVADKLAKHPMMSNFFPNTIAFLIRLHYLDLCKVKVAAVTGKHFPRELCDMVEEYLRENGPAARRFTSENNEWMKKAREVFRMHYLEVDIWVW